MNAVGLSDGDRSYVLDKTRAAIAKLGQTNYGELAGFMKDSMDSRYCSIYWCRIAGFVYPNLPRSSNAVCKIVIEKD